MVRPAYASSSQWYYDGPLGSYVRTLKSPGGVLDLFEVARPAGDMSRPGLPDIVLYQDMMGSSRVSGDLGGGRFDITSEKGGICLAAPNFSTSAIMEESHQLRSLAFPTAQWQSVLDEAGEGRFSFDSASIYGHMFDSPAIRSLLRNLWVLGDEEGAPSRLLARAAGCEILAELCRLSGTPFAPAKGGLALWAERRCVDLMRARLSEDISLDELAAEAQLSPFHFARMFKQSVGVPPRVYLTRLRMEKACELLEQTDLSITEIALEVGYSSNQVLARVFVKHQRMSPTDYRRAVRNPPRRVLGAATTASNAQR
ncbi:transcriptional regulator, AraC family [Palleronia marisminoris]|uniref:HTH-type transcriptional regulator YesS n=1 Tax=Palleronia marisminoris TaxID=315423 RepID=A0A1Y5TN07_9RHOB|nr:AraC family transcriptional regulator [Palleronia marisminoris]SFH45480.1 transcriptional regulator, AraC family [Palleronia marisminoris]SLN67857.1 HTH-type transcriptional regulator YesS [Palleronia marisminoris]